VVGEITAHILLAEVDNQVVVLDTKKNEYFVINKMGKLFIEKLREGKSLEAISKEIAMDFDVTTDQIEHDLTVFIHLLFTQGIWKEGR
jgi:hypothetical protein